MSNKRPNESPAPPHQYVNAKVVLVGETGVGKTALGARLAEGVWRPAESTHGMNVWRLHSEPGREVMLWDFAGQDEYKLVHQLFLNETNVALMLYDPTKSQDTFEGIEYWEKALRNVVQGDVRKILVAARVDVGGVRMTAADIEAYCKAHGYAAHLVFQLVKGKYRGLNTSLPAVIESEILSKKELLNYDGDIYDEFCSMLHDAVKEIYIVVNEREWVFRLALSIINALMSGVRVNVRYYPSENKESHKIQFLRDLGCNVSCAKVGQTPPFLGVIADPHSEDSATMLIYITNPGRHRVKARVYRGPVDFTIIRSTYLHAIEERVLPSAANSQPPAPRIERVSTDEMIEALRKTKIYRDCKMKVEQVNPENTRPIASAVKAYKLRQISVLRKMLRESKIRSYEPAAVIYSGGKKKYLVPPVLESHSVGLCVAEGHTRLHQSIHEGDKKIIAVVVYGVGKPFSSPPMVWDDVTIDRRAISSGGIVRDTTLIRDIEKWVHWEGELPH